MNTRSKVLLSCFLVMAIVLTTSSVSARSFAGAGGARFSAAPSAGGRSFMSNGGGRFGGQHWRGGNWGGDWRHHHHHDFDSFIFFGGFPFWGWGWGYPYYGYPYGYYPYGYYPYAYYGDGYYGAGDYGYGYASRSHVAEMQRRLARAGYYRGAIDGIMGPQTRRALRNYQRDHGMRAYGFIDREFRATSNLG
jgi:hypothetical protein